MGNSLLPLYPKTAGGFPPHFKRDGEESRFWVDFVGAKLYRRVGVAYGAKNLGWSAEAIYTKASPLFCDPLNKREIRSDLQIELCISTQNV